MDMQLLIQNMNALNEIENGKNMCTDVYNEATK